MTLNSYIYKGNINKKNGNSVRCIKDKNTSISNSINTGALIFFPNPATEKIYFKNINCTNALIIILNLQGKQVLNKQINSNPIDISNLGKGVYIVKFVGSENVLISKFIKE